MSNIVICHNKLLGNKRESSYRRYYSIPVALIKAVLTYTEKPALNHFEKAILELLLGKYYTPYELSEILMLKLDLVEMILNSMQNKAFLNQDYRVTSEGERLLQNLNSTQKTEICYLFYDCNRGIILDTKCGVNDLSFYEANNSRFEINTDAADEVINYTRININNVPINDRSIELYVNRIKFNDGALNLKSVDIIDIEHKNYDLVGYGETIIGDYKSSRWSIYNPISFEIDHNLQNYFYSKANNESVSKYIQGIMNIRIDNSFKEKDESLYETISKKLFTPALEIRHKHFIRPLMNVINSLGAKNDFDGYNDYLYNSSIYKEAILNLAELFENVLYESVVENINLLENLDELSNNSSANRSYFKNCASKLNFYIDDRTSKLFTLEKNSLKKVLKNSKYVKIDNVIALSLLVAERNPKYYFNKLAKYDPNFILKMYEFKRDNRDEQKHTTSVRMESTKEYIELLMKILEMSFGYKLNKDVYDKYIEGGNKIYDYSYQFEYVRSKIPALFTSNNKRCSYLKTNFIEMYKNFMWEKPQYISNARSIVEDLTRFILIDQISRYDLKIEKDDIEIYKTAEDFFNVIQRLGFNTNIDSKIGSKLQGALDINISAYINIYNGQFDEYSKTNLRFKLQSIVIILNKFKQVKDEFLDNSMNVRLGKLFTSVAEIMYVDRQHQQNTSYNKEVAEIIIKDLFDITNELLENNRIVNLE